jgi:hypothetical protein
MPAAQENRAALVAAEIAKIINTVRGREAQLVGIASSAELFQWTEREVEAGFDAAKSQLKLRPNSLGTFRDEIKRACNPRVRPHATGLAKLARDTWESEGQDGPCHKAFQRCYHLISATFTEILAGGHVLQNAMEVTAFAARHDPDLDYAKVLKRLRKICMEWQDFARDFPLPHADKIDQYFAAIRRRHLKAAREVKNQLPSVTSPQM